MIFLEAEEHPWKKNTKKVTLAFKTCSQASEVKYSAVRASLGPQTNLQDDKEERNKRHFQY